MAYEIVSTHFVAHEHDLADAYELYRARVAMSRAEVVAISPSPHPIDSEFFLWDLRCQAAYDNLPAPETMQLYELNALVDFVTTDRDEAVEDFFFEGPTEPTAYPAFLGGLADFRVRDAPTDAMSLITVIYLGAEHNAATAEALYQELIGNVHAVAYQPNLAESDSTEQTKLVGPLWLRDATLNIIGKGDGLFSPGKTTWTGWFLTGDTPEAVEKALTERIDASAVVLSRTVAEPF